MKRGEIWWWEDPDRQPRPVCILTRDLAIPVLNSVLVVPATRTIRDIPSQVKLDSADGMPEECALNVDNLFSARKALLTHRVTTLSSARMSELCRAVAVATDCQP